MPISQINGENWADTNEQPWEISYVTSIKKVLKKLLPEKRKKTSVMHVLKKEKKLNHTLHSFKKKCTLRWLYFFARGHLVPGRFATPRPPSPFPERAYVNKFPRHLRGERQTQPQNHQPSSSGRNFRHFCNADAIDRRDKYRKLRGRPNNAGRPNLQTWHLSEGGKLTPSWRRPNISEHLSPSPPCTSLGTRPIKDEYDSRWPM